VPDVGLPNQFEEGTISGWDMNAIYLDYDIASDTLYVGIDCFGICGDADGDGDPGATGAVLDELKGSVLTSRRLTPMNSLVMLLALPLVLVYQQATPRRSLLIQARNNPISNLALTHFLPCQDSTSHPVIHLSLT